MEPSKSGWFRPLAKRTDGRVIWGKELRKTTQNGITNERGKVWSNKEIWIIQGKMEDGNDRSNQYANFGDKSEVIAKLV